MEPCSPSVTVFTGGPGSGIRTSRRLEQFLTQPGVRVFALECSYGMTAWVAAALIEERVMKA